MTMPENKIKEITFNSDTKKRKEFFTGKSFSHPAKMILGLQIYLIEHYTKPGDTILDPMAGSGTILIACTLGRNVVLVELENKFVKMQQDNWQKIKSLGPMLGFTMGEAIILQGDAHNLDGLLADNILFSPPYAEATHHSDDPAELHKYTPNRTSRVSGTAGERPDNIGNLPYGEVSAVISSPPHGNRLSDNACKDNDPQRISYRQALDKADAIITSPPYAETIGKGQGGETPERLRGFIGESCFNSNRGYSKSDDNIGNLKSKNYLEAMLQVYRQCQQVLRDNGLMVLVVKNFIRDKKIVRLDLDTIKLCEEAGFKLIEQLKRKLTQQSFWRTIYYQKFPNVTRIEHEDVLIFEKKPKGRPPGEVTNINDWSGGA